MGLVLEILPDRERGRAAKPHCREISTDIARWIHRETESEWPINMY